MNSTFDFLYQSMSSNLVPPASLSQVILPHLTTSYYILFWLKNAFFETLFITASCHNLRDFTF